jgi:RNA polymerase sigma-70 factor, ECF subfamily
MTAPIEAAKIAFPCVSVDPVAFASHLSECVRKAGEAELNAEDLYLAFACGQGDRTAQELVERRYLSKVGRFIAHLNQPAAFIDEVRQILRERLLFGTGDCASRKPQILGYRGRGSLRAWFRVTAVRQALDLMAREKAFPVSALPADDQEAAFVDPELIAIHRRHLPQLREAFESALGSLDESERRMLRFYLVDGLNIGRIGAIFGKSRATVGRMMVECREKLHLRTRRRLGELTGAPPSDVHGLIGILRGQLDFSVSGFLLGEAP